MPSLVWEATPGSPQFIIYVESCNGACSYAPPSQFLFNMCENEVASGTSRTWEILEKCLWGAWESIWQWKSTRGIWSDGCQMSRGALQASGDLWSKHPGEHHKGRTIYLGSQEIGLTGHRGGGNLWQRMHFPHGRQEPGRKSAESGINLKSTLFSTLYSSSVEAWLLKFPQPYDIMSRWINKIAQ